MTASNLPSRVLATLALVAAAGCNDPAPQIIIYPDASTEAEPEGTSGGEDSVGDDESSGGDDSFGDESSSGDAPDPACKPTGNEWCNGLDDDCDGDVDEICPGGLQLVVLTNDFLGTSRALGTTESHGHPSMLPSEGGLETVWGIQMSEEEGYYHLFPALFDAEYALDSDTERPTIGATGYFSGQFWRLEEVPEGCIRLTNMFQGPSRALDTDAEGNVFFADDEETAGQCWTIEIVEEP